jgi:hypothetical protein
MHRIHFCLTASPSSLSANATRQFALINLGDVSGNNSVGGGRGKRSIYLLFPIPQFSSPPLIKQANNPTCPPSSVQSYQVLERIAMSESSGQEQSSDLLISYFWHLSMLYQLSVFRSQADIICDFVKLQTANCI